MKNIGTAAYEERIAKGYTQSVVDEAHIERFLATVPATATVAQKMAMAQKFAGMIREGHKVGTFSEATAARIADILAGAE